MKIKKSISAYHDKYLSEKYTRFDNAWKLIETRSKPFNKAEETKFQELRDEVFSYEQIVKDMTQIDLLLTFISGLLINGEISDMTAKERQELTVLFKNT